MVKLKVGQWVETENGYCLGPLFQQPNGQYTFGMQFITWNENGITDEFSNKEGYSVVNTWDEKPKDYETVAFYLEKFRCSLETARLARNSVLGFRQYRRESLARIETIYNPKLKAEMLKEWKEDFL